MTEPTLRKTAAQLVAEANAQITSLTVDEARALLEPLHEVLTCEDGSIQGVPNKLLPESRWIYG